MNPCSAVFDIGTSSLKGALIDAAGNIHAYSRIFFPQKVKASDWLYSFEKIFAELKGQTAFKNISLCGICISGNGPTLAAVSLKSAADDKLFLWNEKLPNGLGLKKTANSKSIFMPRIEALNLAYPEVFANADIILSGQEFLIYKLTGKKVTVLPEKRYKTAYWTEEDLKLLNTDMPPFVPPGEPCGTYMGVPVFAGVPDFIAALIGTNTISPGTACDRAGSSEGLNLCVEHIPDTEAVRDLRILPSPVPPFWNLSFIIPDSGIAFYKYLTANGGSFENFDTIMEEIAALPQSKDGIYPDTRAGKGRVLIEKLAIKIKFGMDTLEKAAEISPVYTVCGGQAKNDLWCKIKTEITGRKFKFLKIADAELLGNAAIVFTALREYKNISQAAKELTK